MNISAVAEILDNFHKRICILESALSKEERISTRIGFNLGAKAAKSDSALTVNEKNYYTENKPGSDVTQWAEIVSNMINDRIKSIISNTYNRKPGFPLAKDKCTLIIVNLIVPIMKAKIKDEDKEKFGSELRECLKSIFRKENWARGDEKTHKYLRCIWDALKELGLWIKP